MRREVSRLYDQRFETPATPPYYKGNFIAQNSIRLGNIPGVE